MSKQKRLRIALVTDDFYPSSGGICRSIQTQINELTRLGHEVVLLAPKHFLERPDNCETVAVPSLYFPGAPAYTCILRHSSRLARQISRKHTFDAIHSQTERGGLILAAKIARLQHIPHVHTFHANLAGTHASQPFRAFWGSLAYFMLINPITALAARKYFVTGMKLAPKSDDTPSFLARFDWYSLAVVASRVDAFSAPANFMIERISDCSEALKNRGSVIPTGINRDFLEALAEIDRQKTGQLRFLSVCRLSPEKRVDVIISAFIKADIPNSRLDIVGHGDQKRALERLAAGHKNIYFHGHLSSMKKIAEQYRKAGVFVLASHNFDTQAITIAEAVTAGLPVIYCDPRLNVGLNQKNSILAASPSVDDVAAAMRQIADAKLRHKLAAESRKIAPSLSAKKMAKDYVELYRKALQLH